MKIAIAAILGVWALGAAFFPLSGMIHFLLIVATIVGIIGYVGREGSA